MRLTLIAMVAILGIASSGALAARTEVDPPIRATIRLPLKDQTIDGLVRAWDERAVWVTPRGADASQGAEIAWIDVDPDHTYRLWMRLMDKKAPSAWMHLGIVMLDVADVERAERAFAQGGTLDPAMKPVIAKIREVQAAGGDAHALVVVPDEPAKPDEAQPMPDQKLPDSGEPELETDKPNPQSDVPDDQKAVPWPVQTEAERALIVADLKRRADELVRESGLADFHAVETEYFLFCSNLPPPDIRRWSEVLDKMYRTLLTTLEIPKGTKLFHGKCVVIICRTRDDFLAFERSAFEYDAQRAGGVCHMEGPETWVCFYREKDDARFQIVLVHETTHAFMHRYKSAAELPTWANEGLADYVAGVLTPESDRPATHWKWAARFARAGGDPLDIMAQSYEDGTWYTSYSYPIAHMLVRYMIKYKPRAFKEWIDDIKADIDWRSSMQRRFGITPELLAKGFIAETLSERSYTPTR